MNTTPESSALATRLNELERKLDLVLEEVAEVRRIRREFEEFEDDAARVGKDMLRTVVSELDQVAPFVRTGDFAALLKRLVRNVHAFDELLVQFESARAFLEDAAPLGRRLSHDTLVKLDELDRKGYFAMGRELARAADNVVASFTVEDVRLLADNLVAILQTLKNLTQPEMLHAIDNAVGVYRNIDFDSTEEYTLWRAFREVNKPEMRRGLGFVMNFLRNLGANTAAGGTSSPTTTDSRSTH